MRWCPYRDPAPAFSTNRARSRATSARAPYQTEPNLAVDPTDPEHLVLGTIDYNFPSMSSYVSLDGGESWDGPHQAPYLLDDLGSGGDPSLAFDQAGNVYMTSISIGDEEFTVGPITVDPGRVQHRRRHVRRRRLQLADDHLRPHAARVSTSGLTPDQFGRLRGDSAIGFLDKPWIAIGPIPDDPTQGRHLRHLHRLRDEVRGPLAGRVPDPGADRDRRPSIHLVRSEDGGKTWSKPVAVSPTVTQSYGETEGGDAPGELTPKRIGPGLAAGRHARRHAST